MYSCKHAHTYRHANHIDCTFCHFPLRFVLFCRKQMEICLQVTQLQARNDPQQQTKQAQFINIVSLVKYNNRFRFTHLISREIRTCSRFLEPRPRALGPSKIVKNLEKNKPMLGAESQSNSRPRASYFKREQKIQKLKNAIAKSLNQWKTFLKILTNKKSFGGYDFQFQFGLNLWHPSA